MFTGSFKPGTTLFNLMHKVFSMRKGNLGKVFVSYGEPIKVSEYVQDFYADFIDKNIKSNEEKKKLNPIQNQIMNEEL